MIVFSCFRKNSAVCQNYHPYHNLMSLSCLGFKKQNKKQAGGQASYMGKRKELTLDKIPRLILQALLAL